MGYVKNILVAFDQLGNAFSGGNPDATISGRTGYFAVNSKPYAAWFWLALEFIINTTFWPFDGKGHCYQAWQTELDEEYYMTRKIGLVIFACIAIFFCAILITPHYLFHMGRWVVRRIKNR